MRLVRSNQSEVQTSNGYTTTLLAQIIFDSQEKLSRLVEDPNLHGDEVFVKLVIAPGSTSSTPSSFISLIRNMVGVVNGLEKPYYDTYPIMIADDGSILLDSVYYLEDTALLTVTPFMEEWLKELYVLAKETLARMYSENVSLSEVLSDADTDADTDADAGTDADTDLSESLNSSHSETISESESLVSSESQGISELLTMPTHASLDSHTSSTPTSMSDYINSNSESLELSEPSPTLSVSMFELDPNEKKEVFDKPSASKELETSNKEFLENLALQLEPFRQAHESGEISTGDLLEQLTREVSLPNLKEDISNILNYEEESVGSLDDILVDEEDMSSSSNSKPSQDWSLSELFGKKRDSYTDLIASEVDKQINAVNNPTKDSVKPSTEIEICGGAYTIAIED